MSGLDLRALREAAEAATPGPWQCDWQLNADRAVTSAQATAECWDVAVCEGSGVPPEGDETDDQWARRRGLQAVADAAFIAAANPSAVLALLDRLEAAEGAVERVRSCLPAAHEEKHGVLVRPSRIRAALDPS